MTKRDVVEKIGLEELGSFDYALPQDWVDEAERILEVREPKLRNRVVPSFVWLYDKGSLCGRPASLSSDGDLILAHLRIHSQRMYLNGRFYLGGM